jgi:EAL domain-containing protein (putative c-di-GMP-specific phosphodiesterase class I)/GGDEF domain-containing protein
MGSASGCWPWAGADRWTVDERQNMTPAESQLPPVRLSERVRLERDRHVAFAFAAADLLIEAAVDSRIVAASGAARAILGLGVPDLIGKCLADIVAQSDQPLVRRLLKQVRALGRIDPAVLRMARTDGTSIRILFGGCCLPNEASSVFLSVTLLPSTLTPAAADHDEVTGLLTLEALREAAQRATSEDENGRGQLGLVRLDGLSGAVRQLPPTRAAMLMQEIGAALRAVSVGGEAAGRLSEDAFGIVTRGGQTLLPDGALVSDLSDAIRAAGVPDGKVAPRIALIDLSRGRLNDNEAGRALTYAISNFVKAMGGEFKIVSLHDGLAAAINEAVSRFANTQRMVADRRFEIVYQPVVDLSNRAVHHYEALSRFPGTADTFETVGFMEDVGLVAELDLAVCRQVIEALEQNPEVRLAVNLSGRSIQDEGFRGALSELVRPLMRLRQRLLFELTESAAIDDLEVAAAYLGWLRKLGHAVCLDDFGSGAAAYNYLRRFDVDFVKIDGPFLKAASDRGRERALIQSISVLCHEIDCKVIGEMIEGEELAALAATLGIDFGQGWLFGKPIASLPKPVRAGQRKGTVETWE